MIKTKNSENTKARIKILFFSHAVTMAHFTRPLKWIESLDQDRYDIYLASHPKFRSLVTNQQLTFIDVHCIDAAEFAKTVEQGKPIYDRATFEFHVQEDLRVMEQVKPDLVIGDFRHSLSVSCRLKKIKYINLANAYWSPQIKMDYPLPEASIVRSLGESLASVVLAAVLPLALKLSFFKMAFTHRKSFKSAGLSFSDYRQVITDGDVTLYCDTPGMIPLKSQTSREEFVGPLLWSMPVALPTWWSELNENKKRIFLSLGSSGNQSVLPTILKSLAKMDVEVIVALAGKKIDMPDYPNVFVTDYLPMEQACKESDLVICNGGSPMSHAALSYGVPLIGVVSNNDQLLNMSHVVQQGAGLMLRHWNISEKKVTDSVNKIFNNANYFEQSNKIQEQFALLDVDTTLQKIIEENT